MTKNMGLIIVLLGLVLVGIFYYAIYWFKNHPHWQDQNVIFARRILGKGFKVALNGIDWNQNKLPECIAFMPLKKSQKIAPHLQAANKIAVVENNKILFFWSSNDSIAFIPLINSLQNYQIPIIFSTQIDAISNDKKYFLRFNRYYQIVKE